MTNIILLDDHRAGRPRNNVVQLRPRVEQIAERIARHRKAMDRLLQDMGLGWHHDCPLTNVSCMVPKGEACIWCDATDPDEPTPPEAA